MLGWSRSLSFSGSAVISLVIHGAVARIIDGLIIDGFWILLIYGTKRLIGRLKDRYRCACDKIVSGVNEAVLKTIPPKNANIWVVCNKWFCEVKRNNCNCNEKYFISS